MSHKTYSNPFLKFISIAQIANYRNESVYCLENKADDSY